MIEKQENPSGPENEPITEESVIKYVRLHGLEDSESRRRISELWNIKSNEAEERAQAQRGRADYSEEITLRCNLKMLEVLYLCGYEDYALEELNDLWSMSGSLSSVPGFDYEGYMREVGYLMEKFESGDLALEES